jgi:hypothetical protein
MERDDPPSKNCGSGQRFCSAAISAKSIGVVAAVAATSQVGWGEGAAKGMTESQQQHFANQAIEHLKIELRNESEVALLAWRNVGCDTKQGSDQCLVVGPKVEQTIFTEMAKVADGQICC